MENPKASGVEGLYSQAIVLVRERLRLAEEINPFFDFPSVLIIGNTNLKPDFFSLRDVDSRPLGGLVYPGKSAMIDFLNL